MHLLLGQDGKLIVEKPIEYLKEIFKSINNPKLILMHSGYLDYPSFIKFLNFQDNILFDFSYTIMHPEIEKKK